MNKTKPVLLAINRILKHVKEKVSHLSMLKFLSNIFEMVGHCIDAVFCFTEFISKPHKFSLLRLNLKSKLY